MPNPYLHVLRTPHALPMVLGAFVGRLPLSMVGLGCVLLVASERLGIEYRTHTHPIALRVADVAAARAELEARGVAFHGDIVDSGVCHMAYFNDVDGNALMLHHRYAPPDARPDAVS